MVPPAGARVRVALISTCIALAASMAPATQAAAADASAEPEATPSAAAIEITSPASAEPWAETELDGATAIAGGHDRFVAVGSTGFPEQAAAWWSVDGLVWERADLADVPAGSSLSHVVATDDGFVALGSESELFGSSKEGVQAWYSADGQAWEHATIERPGKSGLQAIAAGLADGPAGSVALGSFIGQDLGGQRLWRSEDGRSWRIAKLPEVDDPVWYAVVSTPRGYLLLGQSGRGKPSNWKSNDGMTWKRLADTPRMHDVAVGHDGTMAGIGHKHIFRSADGLRSWEKVWTRPSSWEADGSEAFAFVAWDGSEFVVPGRDFSRCGPATDECHRNPLLVSTDGTSWSDAAGPDGLPGADEATWITDVASLGDSTAILGQKMGRTVIWLTSTTPADAPADLAVPEVNE